MMYNMFPSLLAVLISATDPNVQFVVRNASSCGTMDDQPGILLHDGACLPMGGLIPGNGSFSMSLDGVDSLSACKSKEFTAFNVTVYHDTNCTVPGGTQKLTREKGERCSPFTVPNTAIHWFVDDCMTYIKSSPDSKLQKNFTLTNYDLSGNCTGLIGSAGNQSTETCYPDGPEGYTFWRIRDCSSVNLEMYECTDAECLHCSVAGVVSNADTCGKEDASNSLRAVCSDVSASSGLSKAMIAVIVLGVAVAVGLIIYALKQRNNEAVAVDTSKFGGAAAPPNFDELLHPSRRQSMETVAMRL